MRARSLALRTAAALASACMLLAWVGASWGQSPGKTELRRREYQPPPQTVAPAAAATAEPDPSRAWRLRYRDSIDGTLFLYREQGSEAEIRTVGEGGCTPRRARGRSCSTISTGTSWSTWRAGAT